MRPTCLEYLPRIFMVCSGVSVSVLCVFGDALLLKTHAHTLETIFKCVARAGSVFELVRAHLWLYYLTILLCIFGNSRKE